MLLITFCFGRAFDQHYRGQDSQIKRNWVIHLFGGFHLGYVRTGISKDLNDTYSFNTLSFTKLVTYFMFQ